VRVRETEEHVPPRLFARVSSGERLAGFIYGTIVVLSVIVAEAPNPAPPRTIFEIVLATSTTFWLAHVYAHSLGESLTRRERISFPEVRRVARHEASILEAAVPSLLALLAGAFDLVSDTTSVWLAFALGLGVLLVQGLTFARILRLKTLATVAIVTVNLGLGFVLVLLKIALTH
jgi:hypothetical protein